MANDSVVKWSWHDIQAWYPQWTEQQCQDALDEVSNYAHERIVELGNEVLEQVVYEIVELAEIDEEMEEQQ